MSVIAENGGLTDNAATADVVVDVGSGAGRKVVAVVGWQNVGSNTIATAVRGPGGDDEALVAVAGASQLINNGTRRISVRHFYLDLAEGTTGSQTFRFTGPSGTYWRIWVTVEDGLATGAPEADEILSSTSQTTAAITDDIVTVTDNAVVYGGCIEGTLDGRSWTQDNGQTELLDTGGSGFFGTMVNRLVVATAGNTTSGVTASGTIAGFVHGLAAYAPASGGGGGGLSIPVAMRSYRQRRAA